MTNSSAKEITIEIPGLTIAAKVWGPEDGRPVLSAHGWLDNAASFDRLAPMLKGLRVVAFDFPGHGRSERRAPGASYHFIDTVPLFFDIADALGWRKFSMLCHSMGACAASLVAGTLPERIERMVLLDGLGPSSGPGEEAARQLKKALGERKILAEKSARTFPSPAEAAATLAKIYGVSPENAALLMARGLEKLGPDENGDFSWSFNYDLRLRGATPLYMTEAQVRSFLANIKCPTLLVRPEDGWPVEPERTQGRVDAVSTLEILTVPGNHHVHLEHPERIAGEIQRFLTNFAP